MSGVRILSRTLHNIEKAGLMTCFFYVTNRPRPIRPPGFDLHYVTVGAKRKSTGLPAPSHARSVSYVNSKKQDDTELGRLMHDLHCKNAEDMHSKILADRVYELKETQKRQSHPA